MLPEANMYNFPLYDVHVATWNIALIGPINRLIQSRLSDERTPVYDLRRQTTLLTDLVQGEVLRCRRPSLFCKHPYFEIGGTH
jgi:hypothetical protein